MPFTFSHPAIILPLLNRKKIRLSASALIVGSIIPDFESFIFLTEHKKHSHSWLGVLWFDLPLALICLFAYHNIVREPLMFSLPRSLRERWAPYSSFNFNTAFRKHAATIIVSVLIGAVSHLLWDGITHLNLLFPNSIDSKIYIGKFRLFKVLQYSNSVLGMLYVIWFIYRQPRRSVVQYPAQGRRRLLYWFTFFYIAVLSLLVFNSTNNQHRTIVLYIDMVVAGILSSLLLTSLLTGKTSRD